jgi:hypothetical protein
MIMFPALLPRNLPKRSKYVISRILNLELNEVSRASARLEKFINIMQEQRTQLRVLEASVTAHEQREAELRASYAHPH